MILNKEIDHPQINATQVEKDLYLPTMARITDVRKMTDLEKLFTLELPENLPLGHRPGQFVANQFHD